MFTKGKIKDKILKTNPRRAHLKAQQRQDYAGAKNKVNTYKNPRKDEVLYAAPDDPAP